jgi:hypothetical protein
MKELAVKTRSPGCVAIISTLALVACGGGGGGGDGTGGGTGPTANNQVPTAAFTVSDGAARHCWRSIS